MCPDEHPTLNDEIEAASSAASTPETIPAHLDATPSVPDDKGGESDPAKNEEASATPAAEEKPETKEEEKPAPFHEHPDWQRMMQERNEAVAKQTALEKQIAQLAENQRTALSKSPTTRNYDKELTELHHKLDEGDISATDHAAQMAEILQARTDEKVLAENQRLIETMQKQQQANEMEAAFYRQHPDFHEVMQSGKIAEIKGASPMHDDFSAYFAAKLEAQAAELEQKIADARKDEREKAIKEIKAGHDAASLDGGSTTRPNLADARDDVSKIDSKKHGGVNKVLADKLSRIRRARQGG